MKIQHLNFGIIIGLLILLSSSAWANVKLPALVGDNMVLQRDTKINMWGWADPGEKVSIQFQGKNLNAKTRKDGKWTIILPSFPAGGPFEMIIKGKNIITVKNILVGDVWLASGQSNMEFQLKNANNSAEEIKSANFDKIHLFTVTKNYSFQKKGAFLNAKKLNNPLLTRYYVFHIEHQRSCHFQSLPYRILYFLLSEREPCVPYRQPAMEMPL